MNSLNKNIIFSVIILAYNEEKTIGSLLNRVLNLTKKYPSEIIIIDSESTDQTPVIVNLLKKEHSNIKYYKKERRRFNFGKIRNWGVRLAKGRYICFLSADTIIERGDFFYYLLRDFNLFKNVVAVFGQQIPHGNLNIVYKLDLLCQFAQLNQYVNENKILIQSLKEPFIEYNKKTHLVWYFISNVFACYKTSFLRIYPFKETLLAEDIILGKEIIEKGFTKIYDSRCQIIHYHKKGLLDYYISQRKSYFVKLLEIKVRPQINILCKLQILFCIDINIFRKMFYFMQVVFFYFLKLLLFTEIRLRQIKSRKALDLLFFYTFIKVL